MSPVSVLVLENDSSYASSLKIKLSKWGALNVIFFKTVEAADKYLSNHEVDLFITKPTLYQEADGIEFGERHSSASSPFIFIAETDDNKSYKRAKTLNLLSFLIKPFDFKTIYAALTLYFDNKENFLIIKKGKNKIRLRYKDINWIKSAGNYCILQTDKKEYSMKTSLKGLKQSLLSSNFIQIHRAFIIRIDKIDNINVKTNIVNIKQVQLPIGRKYRKDFFDRIEVI